MPKASPQPEKHIMSRDRASLSAKARHARERAERKAAEEAARPPAHVPVPDPLLTRAPKNSPRPTSLTSPGAFPGLTHRQDQFARNFAQTHDAVGAYRAAGYTPGKSVTQYSYSAELLKKPHVRAAVEHYKKLIGEQYDVSRPAILAQLVRFGWVDVADYLDDDGNYRPIHQLPRIVRMAIKDFTVEQRADGSVRHSYTFVDKMKAIELLAKVTGALGEATQKQRLKIRVVTDSDGRAGAEVDVL